MHTRTLYAEADEQLMAVAAPAPLAASVERRTISGIVAPYGVPGATSAGLVKIDAGAVHLPEPLSRVKLLDRHSGDPAAKAIGVAIHAEDTPAGLRLTFKIVSTPDGDAALTAALEGVKDGLSVELTRITQHGDTVKSGDLLAVAHVPLPAFDAARVDGVAASFHNEEEGTPMKLTPEQRARLAALRTQDNLTQTEAAELVELAQAERAEVDAAAEVEAPAETGPAAEVETPAETVPAAAEIAAARVPAEMTATRAPQRRALDLEAVFDTVARLNNFERSAELTAALEDIAYSTTPFADVPDWVGQLWSGQPYKRKFVPLLNNKTLTKPKVQGWRWVTPPEVDDWTGNKTDIPSNAVEVEDDETTAAYLAGGWDIAREHFDFGNTEFIRAFYLKVTESYAKKTDNKALAAILSSASGTTALTGAGLLKAAAVAAHEVEDSTATAATAILVNSQDKLDLIDVAQLDVPAYLRDNLNIEPRNFVGASSVPAGTAIALTKPALDWYELPGSPIRVEALDIARGGVDQAVHGYWATFLNDERGVRKVTFAPGA